MDFNAFKRFVVSESTSDQLVVLALACLDECARGRSAYSGVQLDATIAQLRAIYRAQAEAEAVR